MRISLAECLPKNISGLAEGLYDYISGGGFTCEYLWRSVYLRISLEEDLYEYISGGGFT